MPRATSPSSVLVPVLAALLALTACQSRSTREAPPSPNAPPAQNILLITIDTLRADRVGAYGYAKARTPTLDSIAASGVRFDHAYATAPITLTSHASLLTGRYPPGHGARHNGLHLNPDTPTLADHLAHAGFSTGGFVAAFPLDHRFGIAKGFATYGDHLPRAPEGKMLNERPGREVADEAIAWLGRQQGRRVFLWVHLFEPHAPYGNPADPSEAARPASDRYDDEVAEADRQAGRVIAALGARRATTLVVIAADHGESFGEHGEIGHSIFVYDTTLRVPLVMAGPGIPAGKVVADPVSLVDVASTVTARTGVARFDGDGVDLSPAIAGATLPGRAIYAESFAPLFDFGWSPLRSLRQDGWKYIAAPHAELYNLADDPGESRNVVVAEASRASTLARRVNSISGDRLTAAQRDMDQSALARLQALGYLGGGSAASADSSNRPDPKDKDERELAAKIAQVTSGELHGDALRAALEDIVRRDPRNPQAHVRLGYVLLDAQQCPEAEKHFAAAIAEHLPTADAHLGLAACQTAQHHLAEAAETLREAQKAEPGNPIVVANLGIVTSDAGRPADALPLLQRALTMDPELHQARFSLALAYARLGRRAEAAKEAAELLRRLPAGAPQRSEVERLLSVVR